MPFGIRPVLAKAVQVGRRHWWRILSVAVTVSAVTTLAELLIDEFVSQDSFPLSLIAGLTASGLSLLGAVFLSGFLTKLVSADRAARKRADRDEDGGPADGPSLRQILRSLPWARLAGADVLVAVVVVIGLLLLVIPGLVLFNLLGLVGPVIEVENRKVFSALRRSVQLVRKRFWTVALLVTLPVAIASEIETLAPTPHSVGEFFKTLAIRGLGEGLAEAAIGLILVQVSYRLIELDRIEAAQNIRPAKVALSGY